MPLHQFGELLGGLGGGPKHVDAASLVKYIAKVKCLATLKHTACARSFPQVLNATATYITALSAPSYHGRPDLPVLVTEDDILFTPDFNPKLANVSSKFEACFVTVAKETSHEGGSGHKSLCACYCVTDHGWKEKEDSLPPYAATTIMTLIHPGTRSKASLQELGIATCRDHSFSQCRAPLISGCGPNQICLPRPGVYRESLHSQVSRAFNMHPEYAKCVHLLSQLKLGCNTS